MDNEIAALQGAKDIIAEMVSENQQARNTVRNMYKRRGCVIFYGYKKMKSTDVAQKFSDYFDFSEPLRSCNSHRLLAMRRGETLGILRVSISIDEKDCIERLNRQFVMVKGLARL